MGLRTFPDKMPRIKYVSTILLSNSPPTKHCTVFFRSLHKCLENKWKNVFKQYFSIHISQAEMVITLKDE